MFKFQSRKVKNREEESDIIWELKERERFERTLLSKKENRKFDKKILKLETEIKNELLKNVFKSKDDIDYLHNQIKKKRNKGFEIIEFNLYVYCEFNKELTISEEEYEKSISDIIYQLLVKYNFKINSCKTKVKDHEYVTLCSKGVFFYKCSPINEIEDVPVSAS